MDRITMSVADTVSAVGLSRTTVYRLIKFGALDVVKIGHRTLVKVSSIEKLVGSKFSAENAPPPK